MIKKDTSVVSG